MAFIELKGIIKEYKTTHALRGIDVTIEKVSG